MNRREVIMLLGSAVAWPITARALSTPVRRIGVLMNAAATEMVPQSKLIAIIRDEEDARLPSQFHRRQKSVRRHIQARQLCDGF
jgi:hypothetical protein